MAHKRILMPSEFATGSTLTADMVSLGMRFAASPSAEEPNIEDTIVAASLEGIIREDYRTLSLLVDWFAIHYERVNVDRLVKIIRLVENQRVKAFWAALAYWQKRDWRLLKLQRLYTQPRLDLVEEGVEFQIKRHGEDERFAGSVLRVPAKLLRHRLEDIFTPHELAKKHRAYYFRVMIGPGYRADMWALIERNPELTPAEIARRTYGSFPTAWEARRDWRILQSKSALVFGVA